MTTSRDEGQFSVHEPTGRPVPVVVHVPHAGTWIPDDERAGFLVDDDKLAEELRLLTDHRTDVLAGWTHELGATVVVNHLSRLVVDPERFADGDEEMEGVGMGFAYRRTAHGETLRDLTDADLTRLRRRWFDPYTLAVAGTVRRVADRHGRCVVLDVHSYPERRLPYELHGDGTRPEICLGTDSVHTPPELASRIGQLCADRGFSVARDTPFVGVYIPSWAFHRDRRVEGLMLEIRRDTYIDETSVRPHAGEERLRELVGDAVRIARGGVTPGA